MSIPWLAQTDIFSAFSLLGFILVCIPLYWNIEISGSESYSINSMIWRKSAMNLAPVWCDIATHFELGCSVAVCSTPLVINRRLYHIVHSSTVCNTRAKKRRNMITDTALGMGIPRRFDILEGVGCIIAIPNTFLVYILFLSWPILIGLVSATYCVRTIRIFFRRRREFSTSIALKLEPVLMGLAVTEIVCAVPLGTFVVAWNAEGPLYPFSGLDDLHSHFSFVAEESEASWRAIPGNVLGVYFPRWATVGCAFVFFSFFGLTEEAFRRYRLTISWFARRVGIKLELQTTHQRHSSSGRLPTDGVDERHEVTDLPTRLSSGSGIATSPSEQDHSPPPECLLFSSLLLPPQRTYHPDSPTRPDAPDVPSSPRANSAGMV
ncbi:STE3-domain-containing protein [Cubamyces sp. BRFM 1775]|nr:STE3-domain-containing protein [Cubamyces sp. BRFM 1775]